MKRIITCSLFVIIFAFGSQFISAQDFNYLPKTKKGVLVKHEFYSLSYAKKYKDAEWVAYKLTDKMIVGPAERKNGFCSDSLVPGGTAGKDDYPGKEYDRGHLCPAEDMSFSQEATDSSFYMSNMTPQMGSFNRGIWKKLEMKVRQWVKTYKELYVISGAMLKNGLQRIGPKKDISVPMEFYKVILVNTKTDKKMIAFLLPHKKSSEPLATFAVPADSIEKITGINFFPALPNKLEKQLESKVVLEGWSGVK
jgi:endonuclease G, mitochondrial